MGWPTRDWIGTRNGKLVVLHQEPRNSGDRGAWFKVQCDCGTKKSVSRANLERTMTCGSAICLHGDLLERLERESMPEPNSGCWLWLGCLLRGYGVMSVNNKQQKAHRVSYELNKGKIPRGLFVCHRCDNPCCVNPDHLFLGTSAENTADKVAKGRQANGPRLGRTQTGSHNANAQLTETQVAAIRAATGIFQKELAKQYGVSQSHISLIKRGGAWQESSR